jgi:hypothetical protein
MYPEQSSYQPPTHANRHVIPLVLASGLALLFGVLAAWLFTRYTDIQRDRDDQVATAVAAANQALTTALETEFAEKNKSPYATFTSSDQTGALDLTYPRTWSAYIEESTSATASLEAYFYPDYVPKINRDVNYALRLSVKSSQYTKVVESYQREVESGELKARAITISGAKGLRFDGVVQDDKEGALVVLPLRDKTISLWTESAEFLKDFNDIVLPNLSYQP